MVQLGIFECLIASAEQGSGGGEAAGQSEDTLEVALRRANLTVHRLKKGTILFIIWLL